MSDFLAHLATMLGLKKSELQKLQEKKQQCENMLRTSADKLEKLKTDANEKQTQALVLENKIAQEVGGQKQVDMAKLKSLLDDLKNIKESIDIASQNRSAAQAALHAIELQIDQLNNPSIDEKTIDDLTDNKRDIKEGLKGTSDATNRLNNVRVNSPELSPAELGNGLTPEEEAMLNSFAPQPTPSVQQDEPHVDEA